MASCEIPISHPIRHISGTFICRNDSHLAFSSVCILQMSGGHHQFCRHFARTLRCVIVTSIIYDSFNLHLSGKRERKKVLLISDAGHVDFSLLLILRWPRAPFIPIGMGIYPQRG